MQLTVPTIFTAQDKFSAIFNKMSGSTNTFAQKLEIAAARGNRAFNKLTPTISDTGKKLIEVGEEAVGAAAIFEGLKFSGEALAEWDTALSSLRTKLSGLSDKDFTKFQDKINQVALDTKESSIEVAAGFEKIVTLNKKFAETADGLGEVSKASILLSKIQKTDVATSADGLVGIMNLYNLKADEADKTVNTLTASQTKYASSITDTMAGLTSFAPIAAHYHVSLQQSTALLDVLAEKQIKGEAAGNSLRMTIIRLQAAHAGYKSGVFNLTDALDQVKERMDKLKTAKEKDNLLSGLFGKRQQATGILLMENLDRIKQYTAGVTGTTEAERTAEISENNLGTRLTQLKNKWVDLLTSQDKANWGLNILKKTVVFVTDHLGTIVTIGAGILAFFAAWKIALIAANIYLALFNRGLLGTAVASAEATTALATETVTVGGFGAAIGGVTTEFAAAEVAATGFFAALSEFVLPAALVALGGLALYKVFNHPKWMDGDQADPYKPTFFSAKDKVSPFANAKEEADYQAWFLRNAKMGMDRSNLERDSFDKLHGKEYGLDKVLNMSALQKPAVPVLSPNININNSAGTTPASANSLDIHIHDPSNMVKKTEWSGHNYPNVKVTKTQGQR